LKPTFYSADMWIAMWNITPQSIVGVF